MPRPARSRSSSAGRRSSTTIRPSSRASFASPDKRRRRHDMSSHREAPGISKDPVADSTDLYAFVSPDRPDSVTLVANYIPLETPAGGPNFYEFGTGVLYEINIDNDGDGWPDVTYQFRFRTHLTTPNSFLYNTG